MDSIQQHSNPTLVEIHTAECACHGDGLLCVDGKLLKCHKPHVTLTHEVWTSLGQPRTYSEYYKALHKVLKK